MEIREAVAKFKDQIALSAKQLDFLDEMCYIKIGMYSNEPNELYFREGKRDVALTLRSFCELSDKELEQLLERNGDSEWLKRTMQKLQ